ncbi:MAG: hypothetical protein HQK56_16275 [Deltaproteobacteria bacterium]|nr:hypothetical protein [Deltaproteobacteria bacterium]
MLSKLKVAAGGTRNKTAGAMKELFTSFQNQYLETALWATTHHETDEPLDKNFNSSDFSSEALDSSFEDCSKFIQTKVPNIKLDHTNSPTVGDCLIDHAQKSSEGNNPTSEVEKLFIQAGHDFFLNRNGHGSGFWDKPEIYGKDLAKALSDIAKKFPESSPYVGDDNQLYFS